MDLDPCEARIQSSIFMYHHVVGLLAWNHRPPHPPTHTASDLQINPPPAAAQPRCTGSPALAYLFPFTTTAPATGSVDLPSPPLPATMYAFTRLGVADVLAAGPREGMLVEDIAAQVRHIYL